MAEEELGTFVRQVCKERGLSLRGLSVAAGLSPGTIHNLINREYQPSIFTLNQVADYLGIKRQYLWKLAGLLTDMDYEDEVRLIDPQLHFIFKQADKLPEAAKNLVINIMKSLLSYLQT